MAESQGIAPSRTNLFRVGCELSPSPKFFNESRFVKVAINAKELLDVLTVPAFSTPAQLVTYRLADSLAGLPAPSIESGAPCRNRTGVSTLATSYSTTELMRQNTRLLVYTAVLPLHHSTLRMRLGIEPSVCCFNMYFCLLWEPIKFWT